MTLPDLIAALAKRPFYLAPDVAGRLTFVQIGLLLDRAGDERTADDATEIMSEHEQFWLWGRQHKLKDYQIRRLWTERHPT